MKVKNKKEKLIKLKDAEFKTFDEIKSKYPWWMYVIDTVIGFIISILFICFCCEQYDFLINTALFFAIWIFCFLFFLGLSYLVFVKRMWIRK